MKGCPVLACESRRPAVSVPPVGRVARRYGATRPALQGRQDPLAEQQSSLLALAQHTLWGTELERYGAHPARPTGKRNTYTLLPRERVLWCLADNQADALTQLAAVLAVGSRVLWPEADVQPRIAFSKDWQQDRVSFDAAIYHGDADQLTPCVNKWPIALGHRLGTGFRSWRNPTVTGTPANRMFAKR